MIACAHCSDAVLESLRHRFSLPYGLASQPVTMTGSELLRTDEGCLVLLQLSAEHCANELALDQLHAERICALPTYARRIEAVRIKQCIAGQLLAQAHESACAAGNHEWFDADGHLARADQYCLWCLCSRL